MGRSRCQHTASGNASPPCFLLPSCLPRLGGLFFLNLIVSHYHCHLHSELEREGKRHRNGRTDKKKKKWKKLCMFMCVRGGIDACFSVCILHLAHDWSGIHLEGREVLSLTDNSFHIVKNHKQTVRVGNCSDDSASTNQSSHTDATLYAKVQLTCSHRGMPSGHSPPWVHFFFSFLTDLEEKTRFTFSLHSKEGDSSHSQVAFRPSALPTKQMSRFLCIHSTHNEISH